ncbi:hypothetical protein BJ875DRAFT_103785 [Amylocarpus encephaloides]|uniref:Uncharacterized protein n=1 Tax=Amylocarpus encephaloides TaxID=45428 RepID=A0A9P7YEZ0_9HELO|nr:hypothetical protein BJ875DRAFT_103785 [Amylocarpus encephaloides]
MTFQWPSTLAEYTPSDRSISPLPAPPLRAFPRHASKRQDVPRGTVASHIPHLQSLASSSTPNSQPLYHTQIARRDSSRTGFGRRLSNRFGEPAFRNTKTDEESPIDNAHPFLGLNTPRKTHEEEHAMAKQRFL